MSATALNKRFFVRCGVVLVAILALYAIVSLALKGPKEPDARFGTMSDVQGSPSAHWLPADLPENASDITVSTDLDHDRVSFTYRATAQGLPPSCVMTGANAWTCGAEDRYSLTFDPDGQRWSGRIEF